MFSFAVASSDVRSILQNLSQTLGGSQPVKCTVFPNSNAFARLVTNARCDQRSSQQSSQSRDHRRQPISAQYDPPWPSPTPPLLSNLALICTLRPNSGWQQLFTESDTWWCFKKRSPHVRQVLGPLIPAPPGVGFPTLGLRWLEAGNLKITII